MTVWKRSPVAGTLMRVRRRQCSVCVSVWGLWKHSECHDDQEEETSFRKTVKSLQRVNSRNFCKVTSEVSSVAHTHTCCATHGRYDRYPLSLATDLFMSLDAGSKLLKWSQSSALLLWSFKRNSPPALFSWALRAHSYWAWQQGQKSFVPIWECSVNIEA